MTDEYRQALKEYYRTQANYDNADEDFEEVAFLEMRAAEARVMALIKEQRVVRK